VGGTGRRGDERPAGVGDGGEGGGEEHAEHNDLKNVAAHHGVDDTGGEGVDDRLDERLGMSRADGFNDVGVTGGKSDAAAGLGEVNDGEPDEERGGRDDFEVDERFRAHAPDFFQRAAAGDPDDDGGENQRRDDGLDEVEEDVAQEVNGVPPIGPEIADRAADDEADEDLGGEGRAAQRWRHRYEVESRKAKVESQKSAKR